MAPATSETAALPRVVIARPERPWQFPDLRELWRYRELFWVLASRDIRIRYKQTALGVAWAIIQPLFTMVAFTAIARVAQISTDGERPEVFYFCGMLPWLLFSNALTSAGQSLVASQHLITKVYFPRIVIPASSALTALIDFAIAFVVLLGMMAVYAVPPAPQILLLPLFVALGFTAALGFGLWLSALTAEFRDVRHATPFLVQLWFFATPILYPSTSLHGWRRDALLALNPVAAVVDGVRWCVLGRPAPTPMLGVSIATILAVLASSLVYFRHVERTLADRL